MQPGHKPPGRHSNMPTAPPADRAMPRALSTRGTKPENPKLTAAAR